MATNLAINDDLLNEAKALGHHKTKKETVNAALSEYIQRHKQEEILSLFNSIQYDPRYNYKKARTRK
jgi:Arc/MetJ family transcription regulator